MKEYRIDYDYPYYVLKEKFEIGWWIFKRNVWFVIADFYYLHEAEKMYKILKDKNVRNSN